MMDLLAHSPFDLATERRVVIIADWLPPDFGAVGQYMQLRAQALAEQGHDVTLIGLASGGGSVRSEARGKGTLTEVRLAARPVPRGSLLGRLMWTLWTDLRLVMTGFRALRAADGVLFTGSPPFMIHLLAPLKFLWRARLVYRITDFHPECLIAAQPRPSRALARFTHRSGSQLTAPSNPTHKTTNYHDTHQTNNDPQRDGTRPSKEAEQSQIGQTGSP